MNALVEIAFNLPFLGVSKVLYDKMPFVTRQREDRQATVVLCRIDPTWVKPTPLRRGGFKLHISIDEAGHRLATLASEQREDFRRRLMDPVIVV